MGKRPTVTVPHQSQVWSACIVTSALWQWLWDLTTSFSPLTWLDFQSWGHWWLLPHVSSHFLFSQISVSQSGTFLFIPLCSAIFARTIYECLWKCVFGSGTCGQLDLGFIKIEHLQVYVHFLIWTCAESVNSLQSFTNEARFL